MSTLHHNSPMAADWAAFLRKVGIFMTLLLVLSLSASAQDDEDWDEDEEEEETEEKALIDNRPSKKEDVTIRLDEELFTWTEEITIHRNDTLTISVRDLAPASRVEITADKGGINLARKLFYSNNEGELDLEIRIGNRKMKGNITLSYTPSGSPKRERSIHLIVD
jgi:hypothetical protein